MNKNCYIELVAKKHARGQDEDQKQNLYFAPSLLEMPKLVNAVVRERERRQEANIV